MLERLILIVLDGVGVGYLPDADRFGDQGADTLGHVIAAVRPDLPNLTSLGLERLVSLGPDSAGRPPSRPCAYGRMAEMSPGKDTMMGHWELTGLVAERPLPTYPDGFPDEMIAAFEQAIGRACLGGRPASGTEIIDRLGQDHLAAGRPIIYTSADSVFQIAAHRDIVPLETLYDWCRRAREILTGPWGVGRVIARPFTGRPGDFRRDNSARRDFAAPPPGQTLLDLLSDQGYITVGLGKIGDIFAHRGLTEEIHTDNNDHGLDMLIDSLDRTKGRRGLIMINLVDFDMVYGHRRNPAGFGAALEAVDRRLPEVLSRLGRDDLTVITADHGCDPTWPAHTDHTREYVPLLIHGPNLTNITDLDQRGSLADCGQTIAELFGLDRLANGTSFAKELQ